MGLPDAEGAEAVWMDALCELSVVVPDRRTAAAVLARCMARLILSGDIEPYRGAKRISEASLAVNDPDFHDLDTFIYAADEWEEERPEDRGFFDEIIVQEAHRWAAT
jgi:hypothetical protein